MTFDEIFLILIVSKIDFIDLSEQSPKSQLIEHFSHISLPIALLIVPFRKRFFFHFTGNKQTNKPDKPEWFLSRVLSWIRDYRAFIVDWLGTVFKENDLRSVDSQVIYLEFHYFSIGKLNFCFVLTARVHHWIIAICCCET